MNLLNDPAFASASRWRRPTAEPEAPFPVATAEVALKSTFAPEEPR